MTPFASLFTQRAIHSLTCTIAVFVFFVKLWRTFRTFRQINQDIFLFLLQAGLVLFLKWEYRGQGLISD